MLTKVGHFLVGLVFDLLLGGGRLAFILEDLEVFFELLGATVQVSGQAVADLLLFDVDLVLQSRKVAVTRVFIHRRDHVGREVDDLFEVFRGQVEQVTQA